MQFRELKSGNILYVYDRSSVTLSVNNITSVSSPRMDKINNVPTMVVDVVTETNTYTFRESSEIGYFGNTTVTADKSLMLKEVEAHKANNETMLSRIEILKSELPKIEKVLDTLNPTAKEKKEQEQRLTRLEDSIGKLNELVEQMLKNKKNG